MVLRSFKTFAFALPHPDLTGAELTGVVAKIFPFINLNGSRPPSVRLQSLRKPPPPPCLAPQTSAPHPQSAPVDLSSTVPSPSIPVHKTRVAPPIPAGKTVAPAPAKK